MEFAYTVSTPKTFDEAVSSVQDEIAKAGMRVLYVHDVQKSLGEKGFERGPFKIIEFCNAKFAHAFLEIDVDIGLCLPCKVNVYVKDGQTVISAMRPIVLTRFFPQADLGERPGEIDATVTSVVDRAR
ncbi:DUF302 domain-containing protein [Patescibacteria group bacterium]|nr:MAG: DUF302 domain-containing protein [Patescibacteria group bacterium]